MKYILRLTYSLLILAVFTSCSTKVNNAGSRFWQSFSTRYNVYFNGHEAYKEGLTAKEKGCQDNYTERLPLFMVANEKNAALGKGNFETCIEKMKKAVTLHSIKKRPTHNAGKTLTPKEKLYMQRKEFNPFLKRCWIEMGKAQFQMGEFEQAAATFSYICRLYAAEPLVATEARSWLARCYAQVGWLYDAEDVLARQSRDTIPSRMLHEREATMADLLLRQERFEEALPYIRSTIKGAKRKSERARLYFLLGQVERALSHDEEAYKAWAKCISCSPAYQVQFNARILQTEVLGQDAGKARSMVKRLKHMAKAENNKEFLDQVYYAMGNIYMAQGDTAQAIASYETGRTKATRSGVEKGVLLLTLGEVYWNQRRFDKAQPCYSECISLLGKEHIRYQEVMKRSKVLDELVPYTSAVFLQDSLQTLAKLPEAERLAAIDRVIDALKKKEAEERKARRDSAAQARAQNNGDPIDNTMQRPNTPTMNSDKSWYFYNVQAVSQGKQDFRRQWGNRKNEDDWRRANHTVVKMEADESETDSEHENLGEGGSDTALNDSTAQDGGTEGEPSDSLALDPHNREYYLAQIPFTEEQMAASNDIIKDGLYNAGVIEKDKLDDFPLAAETLGRLIKDYPECTQMEDALYHMFLLYSRWQKPDKAEYYRQLMARNYPNGAMTRMITDPEFELLARYGLQIEDSLYTETYQAYRNRNKALVDANCATSERRFPTGLNRPKFMFVHALNNLGTLPSDTIIAELRTLLKDHPKSDVAEMAGMIVKGLESGRTIGDGMYDIGSLWSRRDSETAAEVADVKDKQLVADRTVPFMFVLAYPTDSIDSDRLLYEVAHFNFNSFMVRGFELSFEKGKYLSQFRIAGFNTYEEAHVYAQKIYGEAKLRSFFDKGRIVLISEANLPLLGKTVSYDQYQAFFDENYAPLELPEDIQTLLEEPEVNTIYEDEQTPTIVPDTEEDDTISIEGDTYIEDTIVPVEDTPAINSEEPIVTEDESIIISE